MTIPKQVISGLQEAVSRHSLNADGGIIFTVDAVDGEFVRSIRHRLNLTQREFAIAFGFSLRTLQKWESNERTPEGPARAYLMVISEIPELVLSAFRSASVRRIG